MRINPAVEKPAAGETNGDEIDEGLQRVSDVACSIESLL
jgi:hypothetical protein